MKSKDKKVLIIGLDCSTPQLMFDQWLDLQPNIKRLAEGGIYGKLESTIPAITVPAWMSMMTSKNPGRLGFYGFRNRKDYSYDRMFFATSASVKEDTTWDILSRHGKNVIVVGVPPTYPPKPVNGVLISCFLTPDTNSNFTYPASLKTEIKEKVGDYIIDVADFRTENKQYLLEQIYKMTEARFQTFEYLLKTRDWDFAMMVEMGPDRMHHGMWKYFDPEHIKYEPGTPYENAIKDYYIYLDEQIGRILDSTDDNTAILIVSDHGAKRMDGGICFNDWLIQERYLTLKEKPTSPVQMKNEHILWEKTKAWGSGGYYGRLFLNVKEREPLGVIEPQDYEKVRDELIEKISLITDHNGKNIGSRAFRPEDIYGEVRGIAPDLIVYFGDLYWRSVGTVGNPSVWTFENDIGPDDANHAQEGILIMHDGKTKQGYFSDHLHVMDVAPTVLDLLDIPIPADMEGTSVLKKV